MRLKTLIGIVATAVALAGCGDDDDQSPPTGDPQVGDPGGSDDPGPGGSDNPPDTTPQSFVVTIENVSADSALPGPFAPGAYALHSGATPLFTPGAADPGDGLEGLAEDGGGASLAEATGGVSFGVPVGATETGPIFPGMSYEFTIEATPEQSFSLATMLVQSNDLFVAPATAGVPLFDDEGAPLGERDVTGLMELWDAGTEINQAPGFGLDQAPRQGPPMTGASEGVISMFNSPTRALPRATQLIDVDVQDDGETFTVTVTNTSDTARASMPIGPVFYAANDASWSLFAVDEAASPGLEVLAEDGGPGGLVDEHSDAEGVVDAGAQPITMERPNDEPGPSMPGERFRFSVSPTSAARYVTFATMAVQSNDVFIAPPASGIAFIDEDGTRRPVDAIEADIAAQLDLWDAGTEANQVPGSGNFQPLGSDGGANMGPMDADTAVRRYRDSANDLADATSLLEVSVTEGSASGSFEIVFSNVTDTSSYPSVLTPVAWAIHDDTVSVFEPGQAASAGVESLAEDGDGTALNAEFMAAPGVESHGTQGIPDQADMARPINAGESYTVNVTPSSNAPRLFFATMVVPTNDAFIAVQGGVALLDEAGEARNASAIENEIAERLVVWDAGTEANEPGVLGPSQPPAQDGPNVGPADGSGTVRLYDDPIWQIPALDALIRVTIRPSEGS
ncbi:MAG: spondin domain-containing protein [Myxococcota bacterium]